MTAPLLATRDAILAVIAQHRWDPIGFACACGWAPSPGRSSRPQRDGHWADALAGVVRDPFTLPNDDALVKRYRRAWGSGNRAPRDDADARLDIAALAAALTGDPSC